MCISWVYIYNIKVILIIYVDDGLLISSSKLVTKEVLYELKNKFELAISKVNYCIELEVSRNLMNGFIFICQESYIKQII